MIIEDRLQIIVYGFYMLDGPLKPYYKDITYQHKTMEPVNETHVVYNEEIPNTKVQGFSAIYRKKGVTTLTDSPSESIKTLRDLFKYAKDKHGEANGIGEIKVTKEKDEHGKQIERRTVVQHSYNEIYETAYNLGRYLFSKGLYYVEELKKMKLLGVYSKNRYEWFLSDWAFALFGIVNVPLYDTLGVENLTYCLNQTGITTIMVTNQTLKVLLTLPDIGKLTSIISFDPLDEATKAAVKARNLTHLDFWEIIKEGSLLTNITNDDIVIENNDCATFSYTSGTTGPPKGAMMSNRNLLACVAGFNNHVDFGFDNTDRYLSYLPLPHMMERTLVFYFFYVGANVVISSGNVLKIREDLQTVKATIFISVPRIFSRIAENVKNKFIEMKLPTFHHPGIFAKVRESFGGCIKMLGTGSAPINPEVQGYLRDVFGCRFIEGYGQTESSAGVFFSRQNDLQFGNLSELTTSLEIKLCDIPEMKYTANDVNQKGEVTPRGELWQRGPTVFLGYYKLPEQTKQALDEEGWLRSGDVVQIHPQNHGFRIIDRKKNIFKLQQGEYIAPDRVENVYTKLDLISQAFLHGDSQQYYAVSVVTPHPEHLAKLAEQNGIKGTHQELCGHKEVKRLVLAEINKVGKKEGLNGFELAKNIYLEPKGFLFKQGILTNTMKLIRFEARRVYKEEIQQLYEEGEISLK